MAPNRVKSLLVLALVFSSGCVSHDSWSAKVGARTESVGDQVRISVRYGQVGYIGDNAGLENTSIVFINEDGRIMKKAEIGDLNGYTYNTYNATLSERPEWIVLQPGDVDVGSHPEYTVSGIAWEEDPSEGNPRYVTRETIRVSSASISFLGSSLNCKHNVSCRELTKKEATS